MNQIDLLAILIALTAWTFIARSRRSRLSLPPGPTPLPAIGNILDIPTEIPWERYRDWCRTYKSDIVYAQAATQPIVIVGSFKAAIDLLDKRAEIYSDRVLGTVNELMTWNFALVFMRYSPRWRAHRRMFHQHFRQGAVDKFRPLQRQYIRRFLSWIVDTPEYTREHVRQMVSAIVVQLLYGKAVSSMLDDYVVVAEKAIQGTVIASVPGTFWIDFLPFFRWIPNWLPGARFKRFAEEHLPYVIGMRDKPFDEVKVAVDDGSATESLTRTLLETIHKRYGDTNEEPVYNEIARNITGMAYSAGAETTTSACSFFLLAMAMFPDVQKTAQAELDRIVGQDRQPEFDDLEHMPYIQAVGMEVTRWLPVLPLSIPHAVIEEDSYNGFRIPKGTMIIPNTWAMLHDPNEYPEPDSFKPERFLDQNGQVGTHVRNPSDMAFGFGRRVCPGRYLSNNTLSIFIASVLHVFDITPGLDKNGDPVKLNTEVITGISTMPKHVPCGLEPRSAKAAQLIRDGVSNMADYN